VLSSRLDRLKVIDRHSPIGRLQLASHKTTAQSHCLVSFRTDARKRRQHQFARVGVQLDAALYSPQLEWADVFLIAGIAGCVVLKSVRLGYAEPDAVRPLYPCLVVHFPIGDRLHGDSVVSRRLKDQPELAVNH
jgi:hypothetical protein